MVNVAPELYRRLVERGRADGLSVDELVLQAVTEAAGGGDVRWLPPPTPGARQGGVARSGGGQWPPLCSVSD